MGSVTAIPQYVENINRGYGEHWVNPDNVKISDDTYATAYAGQTDWLKMQDFDFSTLPADAKITGVELNIHCKGLHVKDDEVWLSYEGEKRGAVKKGCREWNNNENTHSIGSSSDAWGWYLTSDIVKSEWFGVLFCATAYDSTGGTASIDYITLTVYYETTGAIEDICSDALGIIGEPAITDINGIDHRSIICKQNYSSAQKRLLGLYDWYFASYRTKLEHAYNCPFFDWAYVYDLPSNFLRMIATYPPDIAYELGAGNKIYMNQEGYIKYVANITDPELFDINFRTALTYKLALSLHACLLDKITGYQALQKEVLVETRTAIYNGTIRQKHKKQTFSWVSGMVE